MDSDSRAFLAAQVLSEDKIVTYRELSRALQVHVNKAKQMLYEFQRTQNIKKTGSVHVTYLVAGTKRKLDPSPHTKDGEDEYMQSSPPAATEEIEEDIPTLSITLVREEDLEEVRSQYGTITSIHVYSLGPNPLKDLQILSDATRELAVTYADRDPLIYGKKYGTITNQGVKRRTAARPPASASTTSTAPIAKPKGVESKLSEAVGTPAVNTSIQSKASQSTKAKDFFSKSQTSQPEKKPAEKKTPAPGALKRESSSIFKSFAKAKPKLKREGTDSSAVTSEVDTTSHPASAGEDSEMKEVFDDDDDEEDDSPIIVEEASKEIVDKDRKTRKAREAALREMMEEDDDEPAPTPQSAPTPEETEVADEPALPEPKQEMPTPDEVSNGRRRGKRRVMKKQTVKDEDGYLVTREVAVWEAFSEDEAAGPLKPKVQTPSSSSTAKSKKSATKPSQGSIMSFFGKKP